MTGFNRLHMDQKAQFDPVLKKLSFTWVPKTIKAVLWQQFTTCAITFQRTVMVVLLSFTNRLAMALF